MVVAMQFSKLPYIEKFSVAINFTVLAAASKINFSISYNSA